MKRINISLLQGVQCKHLSFTNLKRKKRQEATFSRSDGTENKWISPPTVAARVEESPESARIETLPIRKSTTLEFWTQGPSPFSSISFANPMTSWVLATRNPDKPRTLVQQKEVEVGIKKIEEWNGTFRVGEEEHARQLGDRQGLRRRVLEIEAVIRGLQRDRFPNAAENEVRGAGTIAFDLFFEADETVLGLFCHGGIQNPTAWSPGRERMKRVGGCERVLIKDRSCRASEGSMGREKDE